MPRHTAHAIRFYYHEKHKRNAQPLSLNALPDGSDFLDLACEAWRCMEQKDTDKQRSFDTLPEHRTNRVALFKGRIGHYGSPAQIRDVDTGDVLAVHDGNLANEPEARLVMAVPPHDSIGAYMVVEEIQEGTLKGPYLRAIRQLWGKRYPRHTLKIDNIAEPEAWLESASLMEMQVVYLDQHGDLADSGEIEVAGSVYSVLRPPKGKLLPRRMLSLIKADRLLAGRLIGRTDGETPPDSVSVKMKGEDGREKTFAIDHEQTPMARWLFSDWGQPPLNDAQHLRRCLDEVRDLMRREGLQWDTQWERVD